MVHLEVYVNVITPSWKTAELYHHYKDGVVLILTKLIGQQKRCNRNLLTVTKSSSAIPYFPHVMQLIIDNVPQNHEDQMARQKAINPSSISLQESREDEGGFRTEIQF